ncbi:phosphatidylinositide phosphatase [Trichophyton mentagrophytes]|uniref:SAC domain-containing protein n=1 Tax=Trichophyton interdigitale (strain MR816) TaxID=1215338 RepID=A0A059JJL7_TRIIM|nr:hypothetical protein H109_00253 [Trichophyton interdigitale MR816]GBF66368.1 phosphatidylinositide phosphatase [Trichophyton mentagrophytes]
MPGLARKLLIIAAVDGLILQPYHNNTRSSANLVQVDYKTHHIHSPARVSNYQYKNDACLESHGLIGLLSVASYSFLISITQRQQVAHILGKPIFVITGVSIIPLSGQAEASKAIRQAQRALENSPDAYELSDSESDNSEDFLADEHNNFDAISPEGDLYPPVDEPSNEISIAEDVIKKRGRYGRFTAEWFARKGWGSIGLSDSRRRSLISSSDGSAHADSMELKNLGADALDAPESKEASENTSMTDARTHDLLPKLLKYTKMMFGSRSFYFSYDYDITRRFGPVDPASTHVPLCHQANPLYFWNRHLMKPFMDSGRHTFTLPIMQGFIGQHEFTAESIMQSSPEGDSQVKSPEEGNENTEKASEDASVDGNRNFLLTLISRRSVLRSGVRYLRRGIDDDGNTANSVETEQILSSPSWNPAEKVYSLLQLRGSIPLYFSQSPYYFKPVPIMHHSAQTNLVSFTKHFHDVQRRYGKVHAVCLVDKHGVEVNIAETYGSYLEKFNKAETSEDKKVPYQWFDFHAECRGMKFENVSRLVDRMSGTLEDFGDTVVQNNAVVRCQSGVIRTNCMDCLDRTGVSQCAFGQWALEKQLKEEGYYIDLQGSAATQWFNILWADNGDAISKQYSSTAALKGDYTRTRKRDYRGALNDLGLTLTRYYTNIFTDYFSQACIDYLLGNVTTRVFDEFETNLQSADPGISMEKARQSAIETSCQIVISDENEEFIGGWTMLSPRQPNTLRTLPFEQTVLLLTNVAVYSCRFDCNTEKVTSFERIDLTSITGIKYGTYISSTLTDAQRDEKRNMGLAIAYRPSTSNSLRVNTTSLHSLFAEKPDPAQENQDIIDWDLSTLFKGSDRSSTHFLAFKLPNTSSAVARAPKTPEVSEADAVRAICEEIERMVNRATQSPSIHTERPSIVEQTQIISLENARRQTGYFEHLFFDIKKLVWA